MLNIANPSTIFPRSRDLVLADVMNDVDLCVWVADARPGARIVYYSGHLSRDRLPHNDGYSEAVRRKIGELGNAAWLLGNEKQEQTREACRRRGRRAGWRHADGDRSA